MTNKKINSIFILIILSLFSYASLAKNLILTKLSDAEFKKDAIEIKKNIVGKTPFVHEFWLINSEAYKLYYKGDTFHFIPFSYLSENMTTRVSILKINSTTDFFTNDIDSGSRKDVKAVSTIDINKDGIQEIAYLFVDATQGHTINDGMIFSYNEKTHNFTMDEDKTAIFNCYIEKIFDISQSTSKINFKNLENYYGSKCE
ncbi:hypothetical protein [Glaciimonas soli]|uniref:Uncharacterized protein n=1 Tax=Glaciimonas soli TaxID=2590999 RepID=A0A843YVT9_9BURK|nr:hypothetical protein [Glaciimonas soli]MQR02097.1 hypothetical protein [Glaciimonas soli]